MQARIRDAKYRVLGDVARWNGSPVTILDDRHDDIVGFGESQIIVAVVLFRVRKSEVPCPVAGDLVEFDDQIFTVIAEPRLDQSIGEWLCEMAPPKAA